MANLLVKKKNKSLKHYQNRVYDSDGYRRRVDCVLFKDASKDQIMLVSSRNHYGCWTIPGGGLEPGETADVTAVREAREEAGVVSYVNQSLGIFDDKERQTRTEAFSMIVTEEIETWMDRNECGRSRKWFTLREAIEILHEREKHSKVEYFTLAGCTLINEPIIHFKSELTSHNLEMNGDTSNYVIQLDLSHPELDLLTSTLSSSPETCIVKQRMPV